MDVEGEANMVEDTIAVRRRRREKKKSAATSALERIKRNREMGVVDEAELEETQDLFQYVNEDEYEKIVQRRQEEGFVLDDDGSYAEHGREIFDEEVVDTPAKRGKTKKFAPPRRSVGKPSDIKCMLLSLGSTQRNKKKEESVSVKDDELLSNLLQNVKEPSSSLSSRKGKITCSTPTNPFRPRLSSTPVSVHVGTGKRIRVVRTLAAENKVYSKPLKSKEPGSPLHSYQVDDGQDMEWNEPVMDEVDNDCSKGVVNGGVVSEGVTDIKKEDTDGMEETNDEKKVIVPEGAISIKGWETVRDSIHQTEEAFAGVHIDSSSLPLKDVNGEPTLPFYWLDVYEDMYKSPGTVYLIGKVWSEKAQTHVSCCVVVENVERCLYFLPREKLLSRSGKETDKDITFEDLYTEFNEKYAEPWHILKFTSKRVSKRYAFEIPYVPSESEYLEVKYSANYPTPTVHDKGRSFSHIFGANQSCLERLILHCKLKGPSWLNIQQPMCPHQVISWCKYEVVIPSIDLVTVAMEQPPPPPLVVMSLSVKITLNPKSGTNEVLCLGSLVHPDIRFDKPPPEKPFKADLLAIRHPVDRDFPFRFDEYVKGKGFNVEMSPSERAMLAYFLAKVHRADPDIIVGHNLSSFALEILQHRMLACKVPQWSRIGRLKRKEMPRGRMVGHLLCAGRPVCDVKVTAKEVIRAKSYDLPELANTVLHTPHHLIEHEELVKAFGSCEQLGGVIRHTMDEAMLSLRLMYELNALPLAYQITCLAGNTISRTLHGGRAERNEMLLLHAFTAKNYICPDKVPFNKRGHQLLAENGEEDQTAITAKPGRRKPGYSGGLVLEPKRGFYDRYILLLDFNSLYPSIIQEYNICFTTVDHVHCPAGDDGYSKLRLPDSSMALGVLPSEIRVLVERRRQVKQLMKEAKGNSELYMQYNIRQQALKLTANSMYGCLGFSQSRFHAQPLAAIITGKGREILAQTKELTQKLNLDVIYGDTDSIMIDSNTRNLKEAEKIAQRVKGEVNKLYKLLEIDVDGIYKAMLLLRKKKYAAVAVEWRNGVSVERIELKGLDIVRRDWCELAKKCGHNVLMYILSGQEMEKVIESVQNCLQTVAEEIATGKTPVKDYFITKSLTKAPSDYPDKNSLPHVQVALRMQSRNQFVQSGDVIPYIMCKGDTNQSAALRAYHPDEVSKQTNLQVDTLYYLQHQVHAVVSRLCEPIEGLGAATIAEFLGLDPSGYVKRGRGAEEDGEGLVGQRIERHDPFEGVSLPRVSCLQCRKSVDVRGAKCTDPVEGIRCSECKTPFSCEKIINLVTLSITQHIKKYYAGWLLCDELTCRYRTRQPTMWLDESSPNCPLCGEGKLREEFPASQLYQQLVALDLLFSLEDGKRCDAEVSLFYQTIKGQIQTYLSCNQYSKVDLTLLFPQLSV